MVIYSYVEVTTFTIRPEPNRIVFRHKYTYLYHQSVTASHITSDRSPEYAPNYRIIRAIAEIDYNFLEKQL